MYNVPYFNEGCKFELETLHFRYFIIKQILIATFCTWYDSNWPPLIFLLSQETSNVRQLYFGNCDEFITVVFPLINLHWADVLWLSRRYFVIFCSKQPHRCKLCVIWAMQYDPILQNGSISFFSALLQSNRLLKRLYFISLSKISIICVFGN